MRLAGSDIIVRHLLQRFLNLAATGQRRYSDLAQGRLQQKITRSNITYRMTYKIYILKMLTKIPLYSTYIK